METPKAPETARGEMTLISKSVVIKGEISCGEDLYIDSQVEGTIDPKGNRLTIGPNGRVNANVNACAVVVQGFHTYTWDGEGHPTTIDSSTCGTNGTCLTYDALGRLVEKNVAGAYTELLYSPVGKLAIMNGQTLVRSYIPLPGGAMFNFVPGYGRFWHKDWLGTVRIGSQRSTRVVDFDGAFAPFGEPYKVFGGTSSYDFTGDTQDAITGTYDTPNREENPSQGRWISPDPGGLAAVDPFNPQSWNRYNYVANNPLAAVDPTGLLGGPLGKYGDCIGCNPYMHGAGDKGGGYVGAAMWGLDFSNVFGVVSVGVSLGSGPDFVPNPISLLPGENSVDLPAPPLVQSIWQDVLGLPTDLSCPQWMGPLCGGINPAMDASPPNNGGGPDPVAAQASMQNFVIGTLKQALKDAVKQGICGNSATDAILKSMKFGAARGAITGAWAGGGAAGAETLGLGAVPGAILGGYVGGTLGAGGAVLWGGARAGVCSLAGAYGSAD